MPLRSRADRWLLPVPIMVEFVLPGDAEEPGLRECGAEQLQADRQFSGRKAARDREPRDAGDVAGDGEYITEYIASGSSAFSPSLNATDGDVGQAITSQVLNASSKSLLDQRADFIACR